MALCEGSDAVRGPSSICVSISRPLVHLTSDCIKILLPDNCRNKQPLIKVGWMNAYWSNSDLECATFETSKHTSGSCEWTCTGEWNVFSENGHMDKNVCQRNHLSSEVQNAQMKNILKSDLFRASLEQLRQPWLHRKWTDEALCVINSLICEFLFCIWTLLNAFLGYLMWYRIIQP